MTYNEECIFFDNRAKENAEELWLKVCSAETGNRWSREKARQVWMLGFLSGMAYQLERTKGAEQS